MSARVTLPEQEFAGYIFDLDGTLVDSAAYSPEPDSPDNPYKSDVRNGQLPSFQSVVNRPSRP